MPLQATSGAASYDAFGGGVPVVSTFVEDVFSCFLYEGNSDSNTITNGINLSVNGGLVWMKCRSSSGGGTQQNALFDTVRGSKKLLITDSTIAEQDESGGGGGGLTSFNTNGFTITDAGFNTFYNSLYQTYASWTFRKQPKFFDVQTWTGTGANRTISHSLGSVPGSIWVKRTNTTGAWQVYHRSLANTEYLVLNTTAAKATGATRWNSTTPTSSVFSLGTDASVNASGGTYVAYIFAHDAGGFGLTGTDNVISCGSFTTDGSGNASVNLGYEPQFWLYKPTISARYWTIYDNMRGWSQTEIRNLNPNVSDAEGGGAATAFYPTATGFDCVGSNLDASTEHIYIAIRRGPMKVPTVGTSVFAPVLSSATASVLTSNFPVDMAIAGARGASEERGISDRLRGFATSSAGSTPWLVTQTTQAENSYSTYYNATNTDIQTGAYFGSISLANYLFRRAPSFLDVVCYTGTGSNTTQAHNLGVVPELMLVKSRSDVAGWACYSSSLANTQKLRLDSDAAPVTAASSWNSTTPTSSVFSMGTDSAINGASRTYVNYLFATCAGVSKVGSYTGTGTTLQINCGFTGGARFVLIRRTNVGSSDWYVWDSARGIVSGNDPYLLLNSTAAEVTNTDYIDTYSAGFEISSTAPAAINGSGDSFIFLAIA